jgi:hypothetical protein
VIDSGLATPPMGSWTKIHWGLLCVALVVLVIAGQGQHFYFDEWAFVGGRREAIPLPDRYLMPHNEHLSILPLLAYRALGATVGVGSYWPYLGLLLLLHLGVAHVVWRLMMLTGSNPLVATALAAILSVLGAGAENLVWAFQIGFVGSTLLGVSAVHLAVTGTASGRRTGVLAFLTTASLATSGVGLAYLIVVPLVLARRRRRYAVAVFSLPLLAYVSWYAMYGRAFAHPATVSATLPLTVGAFVVVGLAAALTRYFGFENTPASYLVVGVPILAAITLACRDWIAERTLANWVPLAMCVGSVAFFSTAGLARAGLGVGSATTGRYVYVTIVLLLPAIALVTSRGAYRHPRLVIAVVPLAIAVAMSNILQLMTYADKIRHDNDISRRVLVAGADLIRSDSPVFADQHPDPDLAPDLTIADLRSGHLDAAFEDVSPRPLDRLTASLNLQIRVVPVRGIVAASACGTTPARRITVPTGRETTPTFLVTADSPVVFTPPEVESGSARRVMDLARGTYRIYSLRHPGELTIESRTPSSLLAKC